MLQMRLGINDSILKIISSIMIIHIVFVKNLATTILNTIKNV